MPASKKQLRHLKKLADSRRIYPNKNERFKAWRNKNKKRYNESRRKTYKKNIEVYRAMDKRKRNKRLTRVWELKDKPCVDCNVKFHPVSMQFDHVNGDKEGNVSRMNSLKLVEEEAKKCEIVCANCHAVRTWKRRQE